MIVAEISKSWTPDCDRTPLSKLFERVIETNWERGYRLHSWHLAHYIHQDILTETIVAVFKVVS